MIDISQIVSYPKAMLQKPLSAHLAQPVLKGEKFQSLWALHLTRRLCVLLIRGKLGKKGKENKKAR